MFTEKYINLLTDFGFKRVFGSEPNKILLQDFLNTLLPPHHQISDLNDLPPLLQSNIFEQLFSVAEIATLSRDEQESYQRSLKYYRDLTNVIDSSRQAGVEEGIAQGILQVARNMQEAGMDVQQIIQLTGLSPTDLETLTDED